MRSADPAAVVAAVVPVPVLELMRLLRAAGHAAYVVGGSVRDAFLGRPADDWDLTTDALPERTVDVVPGAVYENRFGTVAVRSAGLPVEITTFRSDHDYADYRRPHRVEFGDTIEADLARRDFTVNAMAWGGRPDAPDGLVDPFGGLQDVEARVLRAVGDPERRFSEDALRMIRAVRLAATLGFTIEPATRVAIEQQASLVAHLSGERIASELGRLLALPRPSEGLALLLDTGLLAVIAPELAAQRGIPQNKIPGEDLWDHTLRTVDAAPSPSADVRLAALLHDIGKPATLADGRFHGHDEVGARMAAELLERWHLPRASVERVRHLVRQHMFSADAAMSDAAVRRFILRIGPGALDDLFALRAADDVGSGHPADAGGVAGLRARVRAQLEADVALDLHALAVDGETLMSELGIAAGPRLGWLLDELLEKVIADPAANDRDTLLLLARELLRDEAPR